MGKRILGILLIAVTALATGAEAAAQYASLHRKGTALYSDGMKLTPEQMQTVFAMTDDVSYQDWQDASKGFNAGKGLLISFGVLTGAGILTTGIGAAGIMVEGMAVGIGSIFTAPITAVTGEPADISLSSKFRNVATAGLCVIGAGMLCMVAGTTVYCIYKKRLNTMTSACNASSGEVSLSFGMARHGVGVSLRF